MALRLQGDIRVQRNQWHRAHLPSAPARPGARAQRSLKNLAVPACRPAPSTHAPLRHLSSSPPKMQEGYAYKFDEKLVTVWSAPNYCYRCGNVAAILTINADGVINFSVFEPRPQNLRKVPDFSTRMPDYFL